MKIFLKKIAKTGVLLSTLLLMTACDNPFAKDNSSEIITLEIGKEVEVLKGYKINPTDDSTKVEIRHVVEEDKKYVTLVSGSAQIIID